MSNEDDLVEHQLLDISLKEINFVLPIFQR